LIAVAVNDAEEVWNRMCKQTSSCNKDATLCDLD